MYFYFKSNDELIMSMIKSGVLHTDNVIESRGHTGFAFVPLIY